MLPTPRSPDEAVDPVPVRLGAMTMEAEPACAVQDMPVRAANTPVMGDTVPALPVPSDPVMPRVLVTLRVPDADVAPIPARLGAMAMVTDPTALVAPFPVIVVVRVTPKVPGEAVPLEPVRASVTSLDAAAAASQSADEDSDEMPSAI